MAGKAEKTHGARSELNSAFDLRKWIGGTPLEHPPYRPDPVCTATHFPRTAFVSLFHVWSLYVYTVQ
jgi:hypothetical protein